jgi:hypothetical protein
MAESPLTIRRSGSQREFPPLHRPCAQGSNRPSDMVSEDSWAAIAATLLQDFAVSFRPLLPGESLGLVTS